jgi:hypothetical protein
MSKRPAIDLASLTSEAAAPMAEAAQRTAPVMPVRAVPQPVPRALPEPATRTENLEALAFKVPPAFRKRFKKRAVDADLKLNQLLFAALEAWEEKQGLKR